MVMPRSQKRARNDELPGCKDEEGNAVDTELDSHTSNLCHLVFGIDLLRETIIDYVIHQDEDKLSEQNALTCRLVQKSWLDSVFKCLVKSGKALIQLKLTGRWHSGVGPFLKIYKPESRLTFKVEDSFRFERFTNYLRFLKRCSSFCEDGLVELCLRICLDREFAKNTEKLAPNFKVQSFSFPVLQKLRYLVQDPIKVDAVNRDIRIIPLLQAILSGCLRLKYFELGTGAMHPYLQMCVIPIFVNLLLPATVTHLQLRCEGVLSTNYLEPFIKSNNFPKLTHLTVDIPNFLDDDLICKQALIFAILNLVRNTLKSLQIYGGIAGLPFDVPVMKCLGRIFIRRGSLEWDDGVRNLQLKLPALGTIDIIVTSNSLMKLVEDSKFRSLTDASIEFDANISPMEQEFFTLDHAIPMTEAFHKVTKLKICTPCLGNVNQAVQCLFQNMNQLQVLTIELHEIAGHVVHPQYLDALLLGIPCELIETLKADCVRGKLWEAVQLRMDKQSSVSNLLELQELRLFFVPCQYGKTPIFVSEKVKEFVVSTMPNLQNICVSLPNRYGQNHIRQWKKTGRIFNWD